MCGAAFCLLEFASSFDRELDTYFLISITRASCLDYNFEAWDQEDSRGRPTDI